jgi:hypothetical protein
MKKMVSFKAKPWKTGSSYVITVPSDFIENKIVLLDQETEFQIKEE